MAAGKKRVLDDSAAGNPKAKKTKIESAAKKGKAKAEQPSAPVTSLVSDEVDFPRGGGSSFTPLEVKAIRAEAVKEANDELFQVQSSSFLNQYTKLLRYIGNGRINQRSA